MMGLVNLDEGIVLGVFLWFEFWGIFLLLKLCFCYGYGGIYIWAEIEEFKWGIFACSSCSGFRKGLESELG